jgi:hypothetical protein
MPQAARAQAVPAPLSYLSAASTNCTLVVNTGAVYKSGLFINTTATLYYLKLYDTNVVPTAGAGTPVRRIPIPFGTSSSGGGVPDNPLDGLSFRSGIGFCLTGGIADNDSSNAATGLTLNFGIKLQ